MDREGGLLEYIERRLKENKHMVIVVAEGAGQDLIAKSIAKSDQQDASGNKLLLDIGLWLTHKIKVHNQDLSYRQFSILYLVFHCLRDYNTAICFFLKVQLITHVSIPCRITSRLKRWR